MMSCSLHSRLRAECVGGDRLDLDRLVRAVDSFHTNLQRCFLHFGVCARIAAWRGGSATLMSHECVRFLRADATLAGGRALADASLHLIDHRKHGGMLDLPSNLRSAEVGRGLLRS